MVKRALQLFADLLPVPARKVALKAWFVSNYPELAGEKNEG